MRPPFTLKAIFDAARRSDDLASEVVAAEARHIALAIAAVAAILNPELVILGGDVARNGDLLLEPIERELQAVSPFRPRLALSELGGEAVLAGAVATALQAARTQLFDRTGDVTRREILG
jgi:predicted NBD/HSP70 family sugar kinase